MSYPNPEGYQKIEVISVLMKGNKVKRQRRDGLWEKETAENCTATLLSLRAYSLYIYIYILAKFLSRHCNCSAVRVNTPATTTWSIRGTWYVLSSVPTVGQNRSRNMEKCRPWQDALVAPAITVPTMWGPYVVPLFNGPKVPVAPENFDAWPGKENLGSLVAHTSRYHNASNSNKL